MRIAWLGGARDGGGVPGMGALLLGGVLDNGVEVDYFTYDHVPPRLESHPKLRAFRSQPNWQWNRWYSRKAYLAFFSSMIAHSRAHKRLCTMLLEQHRERRYDVIFQFSLTELFSLGRHLKELPPVVIYPCTHAGGELRWHRRESAYARQSESSAVHYLVRLFLMFRSRVQRRETQKPAFILGMSRRFNQLTSEDYGIIPSRQGVLYHPIATAGAQLAPARPIAGRKLTLLFVGRISVRKGVEQIVELSKRLDDLADRVAIKVVGERTQWSDYRAHLKELNPRTAEWLGGLDHEKTMSQYDNADILLVPSMYEPGGLVVGEALSRGVCVVASDEVGSAEIVDEVCCRHFPAGDMDAFERTTRKLIDDLGHDQARLRESAARQCALHFSQTKIAADLVAHLQRVAHLQTGGGASPIPEPVPPVNSAT
jgi:glycosyltransferase involved in cell wall biosynthesis